MKSKKIAIIFPKDSEAVFDKNSNRTFGGATIHLYHFAKELFSFGDILSIIPEYNNINFDEADKFNFIKLYKETDNPLVKFWKFIIFLRANDIDAFIQLGLTLESCILALLLKLVRIKFVYIFGHDVESLGYYQNSRKRCLLFFLLIKCSYILIAQNNQEKKNLLNKYPNLKKIKVLKKGIDFNKIKSSPDRVFDGIYVARCEPWKNIEAYLNLAEHNKEYKFLLISPPVSGKEDYYNIIKRRAESLDNMVFVPYANHDEVYDYFSKSKVSFLTSDSEGDWPLTVLEAAASGVPIISLNINYDNLIDHYKAGFYCAGDLEKMDIFFQKIMKDKNLWKEMSIIPMQLPGLTVLQKEKI